MPSPARRQTPYEAAAWRTPSSRRFRATAANDNGAVAARRDPTRPSPLVGLIAAGALAVLLIAMVAGVV